MIQSLVDQYLEKDYEVILLIGDNLNDFSEDFYHASLEERNTAADKHQAQFGTKFIVLPNPT